MDGFTSPSSKEGTMNSTVRFVGDPRTAPGTSSNQQGQQPGVESELGQHLQKIVRQELKRIMEVRILMRS